MSDITSPTPTDASPHSSGPENKRSLPHSSQNFLRRTLNALWMPLLALFTSFVMLAVIIWVTSGSFHTVIQAFDGLIRGAFIKQRGFSESLVATVPYILLSLGVAVGFKSGLFNIGVEGQFYIGAIVAAWVGVRLGNLPAIMLLPIVLISGALGGAIWAAIPGYLKARTGAHEVINTIMMNYVAFRLVELLISGPLKDKASTATQTVPVSNSAQIWTLAEIPTRLKDPLNALGVALFIAFLAWMLARGLVGLPALRQRLQSNRQKNIFTIAFVALVGIVTFVGLPALSRLWWPFTDQYDRMHIGLFIALTASIIVWWLLWRTTLGFELRMVGANPNAGRYAGVNITRNIVIAMAISGALAGIAGAIEVIGVTACRCMQLFFSSGYGFDSIAIALLAKNNPFGILISAFLWGAMRNGADLMELDSGVSKYVISLIQALVLLFVAAPGIVRWIYHIRAGVGKPEEEAPLTRGWGGS